MTRRKGIVWLLTLTLLLGLWPSQALGTSAWQEPVCFGKDGVAYASHSYGSWQIIKQPTCAQSGQRRRTCQRCGATQTQTVNKTNDHQYGAWVVTKEATCVENGSHYRVCSVCGNKQILGIKADPNAHAWGEWNELFPATKDGPGVQKRYCKLCGATEQREIAYQGEAGLKLTAGKITRLEDGNGYSDAYAVEMTLENTGDIPLHFALDAFYGVGDSSEVITDYYNGYDSTQDHILQPGETSAFQYVACSSILYFDGERGTISRLVYAGGWNEETGQRTSAVAPILIHLPSENGLQLTVENLHRAGQGVNEVFTFDLTVTNQATGFSVITASASNDLRPLTEQEGFINWPEEGLVLGYGQSHAFSYYFQPTAEEYAKGQEHEVLAWISREITVQDTLGHSDTACIKARIQIPQTADAHLDGTMEKPEYLSLHQTAELPAALTLRNYGTLPITDPVVKGVLTTGGGQTLRAFTLTPENGVSVLQPQESASFVLAAPVGPEDESAAIAEEDALLRFVFWAEYGYEHPEMGAAHGESNLWQQSIPVWDQEYEDPKSTYIMPILTGSFDDSVHHPGDQVWIDLTVENVNPTDTIQGIKFEWYGVDEKGDSSIEPAFTVDMPDVILMPGESYTLKHRFFFGVDQEEALKGHYILDFHAWCHSVTYEWNANCAWSGLIRMEPDEEDGLSVEVTVYPGEYYVTQIETEGSWHTVEEVQGGSDYGYYTGDVSGHTGETVTYPVHPGSFSANVNVNNDSDKEVQVLVSSDHPGDLLNGNAQHQGVIPGRGSLPIDYEIVPTEEETQAGWLTRTVTAVSLDGAITEEGMLSFALRDGGWHLETGWPGLSVTAGEMTQLLGNSLSDARFMADVTVENTGDLPLSLFVESRDGSGADAWDDHFEGWGDGVDVTTFQPGEAFTFQYVMNENATDRMDGFLRRTLNVGGFVEDTEAYVTGSVSFQLPVIKEGALILTVRGHHRSAGPDQAITVDLTVKSSWEEGEIPVTIAAQDENGNAPANDSLVGWPQGGTVSLPPGLAQDFGYVIRPTPEEIDAGEVQRTIIADGGEEPFLAYVTLTYPLVPEEGKTELVHLEGTMQSGAPLALSDAFEAYLTATNLGNVDVEDMVIHGIAQSADGKTLAQLNLGDGGSGLVTGPGEGLHAFPCFPITPEMAVAALSAHCVNELAEPGAVTFSFWAQYTRRYDDGWVVPGVSNLVSFTVPIAEDPMGGILLTGLGNASPEPKEGDPVDIHLVVENIGKEDLVGFRLDAQREGIIGFSFMQTLVSEPLDIIHPGETRPYDFHYTITAQDEDAGFYGFKFVASSESGVKPMMYVSSFEYSQLLLPGKDEAMGGAILIAKHQDNMPPNGQSAFRLNDAIHYTIELTNTYAFPVTNIAVYDDMVGYSPLLVGTVDLESGQTKFVSFTHPVTALDEASLKVENIAHAEVVVNDPQTGELLEDSSVWSNRIVTPVEQTDEDDDEGIALTVTKTVANQPKDTQGYREGETILYDITVHNGHSVDAEIELWDHVWGDEAPALVDAVTLSPGETRGFTHQHTVNKDDIADGVVTNEAYAAVLLCYSDDEDDLVGYTAWAEPVTVLTFPSGRKTVTDPPVTDAPPITDPPVTLPPVTPSVTESKLIPPETGTADKRPGATPGPDTQQPGEKDTCRRVLTGYGVSAAEYELIFCEKHRAVEIAARTMPGQEAKDLWTAAVQEAYDALSAGWPDTAALIETERALFFDQLEAYQKMLTARYGEEKALEAAAGQLRDRCLDLCYALHTAPAQRLDSALQAGVPALKDPGAPPDRCGRETEATDVGLRQRNRICREHLFIRQSLDQQLEAGGTDADLARAFTMSRRLWQSVFMDAANALYQDADPEGRAAVADCMNLFPQWLSVREELLRSLYPQREATAQEMLSFMVEGRVLEMQSMQK